MSHDGTIVGRDEELAAVAAFLDGDFPAALVLAGEAGIGKTTVWRAALAQARERDVRVLVARPGESEARLSFAGLADLLEPVFDDALVALPLVQRRALEAALLLSEDERPAPDQMTISTACLGVFRRLAGEGRVLVAVDDVQWLDPPTALVLEFVARRLTQEPAGLLVAERTVGDGVAPLGMDRADLEVHRVTLGPLSTGALHRLLRDRIGATLTRPALHRVHDASGGNPFYALELVRALQARGGRIEPGRPLPVPQTLEAILLERLEALPAGVRDVVAAAAALARPTESILGDSLALEQAAEAGIIELADGDVRFSHPLLASAAYTSIGAVERQRLHLRLAEAVGDPEERARHLALGAGKPSEDVASALDEAAHAAAARGAQEGAAELAELAVRLTPTTERDQLLRRKMDAAGYLLPAGDLARTAAILEGVAEEVPPGGARADALLLLASAQPSFDRCLELAERALEEAHGDDTRVAKIECYIAELHSVQSALEPALEHARAGLAAAERSGDTSVLAIALSTVAWFETGLAVEPTPGLLERAVSLETARVHSEVSDTTSPSFALSMRLMCAGRLDEARARMLCRSTGRSRWRPRRPRGRSVSPGGARVARRQLAARRATCRGRVRVCRAARPRARDECSPLCPRTPQRPPRARGGGSRGGGARDRALGELRRRGLPASEPQRSGLPRALSRRCCGRGQNPQAAGSPPRGVGVARAEHLW